MELQINFDNWVLLGALLAVLVILMFLTTFIVGSKKKNKKKAKQIVYDLFTNIWAGFVGLILGLTFANSSSQGALSTSTLQVVALLLPITFLIGVIILWKFKPPESD